MKECRYLIAKLFSFVHLHSGAPFQIRSSCFALLSLMLVCAAPTVHAFTSADADTLFEAHTKAFYREQEGRAWFQESTDGGKASYWMRAEQMEMVLDAY